MKVASVRQLRAIEAAADRSVMSYERMMQNAGAAASQLLQRRRAITNASKITILIGRGNNGGDGLVMARDLARSTDADISLYLLEAREPNDKNYQAALSAGLTLTVATDDGDGQSLTRLIMDADIIVDAVLGIGGRPPLRGEAAKLLQTVNECLGRRAAEAEKRHNGIPDSDRATHLERRPFILALDCPSGIDCDTGEADENVIAADTTIAFIAGKPGLFTFPAAGCVGDLEISAIGIPDSLPELDQVKTMLVDKPVASGLLPARPLDGHKGSFGKVMVAAGSSKYIGAIALAAESAYRAGAGLVTIAATRRLCEIVAGSLREPTWLPLPEVDGAIAERAAETVIEEACRYDALLVGCGLGTHDSTRDFLRRLLASGSLPSLVLDADALNLLSQDKTWWGRLPADTIITPHPGELARLTSGSAHEINADRWRVARQCAEAWSVVLLLKGAHTLVAAADGRLSVIPFKTDALSTAGTGDVLAGLIAGLRAQGLSAFDSACLGAYAHASAGVIAAEAVGSSRSVIAGDVLASLGRSFAALETP
ncbi:MAG: NAD(P)H-hydrate dehydratase [Chloroflexi bacterium]|nr:NAD(P)H-hydrate dehydratase [Chloroflexota bacterium]